MRCASPEKCVGNDPSLALRDKLLRALERTELMKVGVIGAGAVGNASLLSMVLRRSAREIVIVNRNRKKAKAVATDMQYGTAMFPAIAIQDGDYSDLAEAAVVMIAAGVNEKTGGATDRSDPKGRLKLLEANVSVYKDILPHLMEAAPNAVVLVLTDPPDPLADFVREFGFKRVLSSGTFLDTLRFRFHLGRHLQVDPASVEAQVVGEHGTSEVLLWSSARVAGAPVLADTDAEQLMQSIEREVRYANITIIEGNQASQYGIGMAAARIAEMVLRDERAVIPIGSYNAKYGVTLSLPSVIGREGVLEILEPAMSTEEREALDRSAQTLRDAFGRIKEKAA
jgi:L-lactate dehydrogenase